MRVGDTLGNAQALGNTVAETVQEIKELLVGDTPGGAQALVDVRAHTEAEVDELPPGDKLDDGYGLTDLLGDVWRHTKQCTVTSRHAG